MIMWRLHRATRASLDSLTPRKQKNPSFPSVSIFSKNTMEPVGAISEAAWNSFGGMYEEADFMAQLLGNFSLPNELPNSASFGVPSTFWPVQEPTMNMDGNAEGSFYCSDNTDTNTYCFSRGSSYHDGNSFLFRTSSGESYYPIDCMEEGKSTSSAIHVLTNNNLMEGDDFLTQEMNSCSIEESGGNLLVMEPSKENSNLSENFRKRSFSSTDVKEGSKRNGKLRKIQKSLSTSNIDEANNGLVRKQSTSSYCSEDESNGSEELNGGVILSPTSKGAEVLNSSGKTRASRGSATDPQSLYARKRRERINERLRILQNLVPNGTKVDISTMLEEAVQYVKFLQLQIKLLSSDDLWMYAPIAYNGMDIGLDLKR